VLHSCQQSRLVLYSLTAFAGENIASYPFTYFFWRLCFPAKEGLFLIFFFFCLLGIGNSASLPPFGGVAAKQERKPAVLYLNIVSFLKYLCYNLACAPLFPRLTRVFPLIYTYLEKTTKSTKRYAKSIETYNIVYFIFLIN
jgi:hypothetical protein